MSGRVLAVQNLHAAKTEGSQRAVVATLRGTSIPTSLLRGALDAFRAAVGGRRRKASVHQSFMWVDVCVRCLGGTAGHA